jgi:hypothetical protein
MIKIELRNEQGEKETFIKDFVSGRNLRSVMDFATRAEKDLLSELEQLDELIYVVVNIFKNDKITFDTILDGVSSEELAPFLEDVIEQTLGGKAKGSAKDGALKGKK